VLLALLLLGDAAGCSATLPEYREARDDWTRHHVVWDNFVAQLFLYATLKTEPFRKAYVKEYGRLFSLTARQQERLLKAELAEGEESWVVIVAMATNELSWNDLDPAAGLWEVRLQSGSNATARPRAVRTLDRRNPAWLELFPYAKDQYTLYELTFDKRGATGDPLIVPGEQLELVVAGAPARVRLTWKIP
jgi:hypothetical protein